MVMQNRLKAADKAVEKLAASYEKQLLRAYRDSLNEIRAKVARMYEKYAKDGVLLLEDVNRYNRLRNLEKEIAGIISKLTGKEVRTTTKALKDTYQEQYYRTAFAMEKEVSAKLGFGLLNEKTIERAVQNPLDRIGWPARTRENAKLLNRQLREQITRGLIQGKSYPDMARDIKERMNIGATKAQRIIQTECHRVQTQGRLDSIKTAEAAGLKTRRVWVSTLDGRTRDTHQQMDGVYADDDGIFRLPSGAWGEGPGLTGDPAEDINCRCTVRLEIEGFKPDSRLARTAGGDNEIISYKTYNEWKKGRL